MSDATHGTDPRQSTSAARRALLERRLRGEGGAGADGSIPPRPAATPAVLSPGQRRLWFLHALDPHASAYVMHRAVRLEGPLEEAALEAALATLWRRHDVLRTVFPSDAGRPTVRVLDDRTVPLRRIDLTVEPAHTRLEEARRHASLEIARPFDLPAGPLFRALLLRLDAADHVLVLSLHHIIADEWSLQLLAEELAAAYGAVCAGTTPALRPVPVQYADYAAWLQSRLEAPATATALDWWRARLKDLPAVELPTDRPRPARQRFRGGIATRTLPASLCNDLVGLARVERVTPFVLLLAAFTVLLHRYTEQTDLVVGTPVTGRSRAELEHTVGFFINTLALRTDLSGDPAFRDVVRRVREVVQDALAHQDVPFEALVDALGTARRLDRNPLFQVMFVMRQPDRPAEFTPGLRAMPFATDATAAKFDLTLFASDPSEGDELLLEYASDLFDADTAARMLEHLEVLLQGIARDPAQRVSALPLMKEAEANRLLRDWGAGAPPAPADACIHTLFAAQAARDPEAPALRVDGTTVCYGELDARADHVARRLRAEGAGPGSSVAVLAERSAEMVIAILGVLKTGAAYVPLDPAWPADRLRLILEDTGARVIVTGPGVREHVRIENAVLVAVDATAPDADGDASSAPRPSIDDVAYIIHTSGSTGRPRGVPVTHAALVRSTLARKLHYGAPPERFLLLSSFAFDSSVAGIFWTLCTGGTLVLPPTRAEQDVDRLTRLIDDERITHTLCLPSLYGVILEHADAARLRSLRVAIVAGETCPGAVARMHHATVPHARLHNEYGPTETTVWCTAHAVSEVPEQGPVPIGRPIAGARVYVLDAFRQPVPTGIPGELYIGGAGVALGYLSRPDETARRFLDDPFDPGRRMYRSGDRARWRADGTLEFLGRVDHQIKVRGHRVEPGEIEAALREHAAVRDAAVAQRTAPAGGPSADDVDALVAALEALDPGEAEALLGEVEP